MSDAAARDRYRARKGWTRGRPLLGDDVETGTRVVLPERYPGGFLHASLLRGSAEAIRALGDARFAAIVSTDPVVIACPDAWGDDARWRPSDALALTSAEAVTAALELVELAAIAYAHGATASASDAWIDRDPSGRVRTRLVAPLVPIDEDDPDAPLFVVWLVSRLHGWPDPSGHTPERPLVIDAPPSGLADALRGVAPTTTWDRTHVATMLGRMRDRRAYPDDIDGALRALGAFASDPSGTGRAIEALRALRAGPRRVPLDLAGAIALAERERAALPEAHRAGWLRHAGLDLAALLHRRACLGAQRDLAMAIADVAQAVALDAHPEYLTTLALFHERAGDADAARAAHDRAVERVARVGPPTREQMLLPPDEHGIAAYRDPDGEVVYDLRDSFAAKAARTLEARGAFRLAHGDRAGARDDFRASLATHPTPSAARRLARVGA